MAALSPILSAEPRPSREPLADEGLERLAMDLAALDEQSPGLPADRRQELVDRISAEPARVETDRDGHITAINPAFTRLCGFSFPEIKGRKPGSFLQGADSDPRAVETLRKAVRAGQEAAVEIINYHKDGNPYRVAIEMQPVHDEAGRLSGFRAVAEKLPLN